MAFRYRADHVGSLLRPQELIDARNDAALSRQRLADIEDKHILRVLQRQKDLGLRIFTDGELRRKSFVSDFYESVDGLDNDGSVSRTWSGTASGAGSAGAAVAPLTGVVVAKIAQRKRLTKHEADFLRRHSPGDIKMTLPTANQFPAVAYKRGLSDRAYPTYSAFLWDIVPIIRSEIEALAAEGVRYIQLDAPRYSYYVDPKWRRYIQEEMG